jgi:hypothetical protein
MSDRVGTIPRRRLISVGIGLALLAGSAVPALAAATVTQVFGSPRRSEDWSSAATGYLAVNQRRPGNVQNSNVLVVPEGGVPTKVNPDGSNADYPTIELGNQHFGDVMLYAEWHGDGQRDVRIYDLVSGTFTDPPAGVNTSASESRPSLSGDHLLFGRGRADKPSTRAILYDLSSGTSRVIAQADYVWVGPINGDWVVYQACTRVCLIYRYQISTGARGRVPTPRALNYFPVIDDDGTVYFGASGRTCGSNVRMMRHLLGADTSSVVKKFPDGVDIFPGDVVDHAVYFGRYNCGQEQGDVYRLTV